jgi:glutaredoxin-related protein
LRRVKNMKKLTALVLLTIAAPFILSSAAAGLTRPQEGKIDLSKSVGFEKYLASGSGEEMEKEINIVGSLKPSKSFLDEAKKIDAPLVIVVYGDMSCPDCAVTVPYVQSVQKVNPLVETRFFLRNDETKAFLRTAAGRAAVPTIFITNAEGLIAGDVYVEYPEAVQSLIDASPSNEEAKKHRTDFRNGLYDEEIQKDLLKLIQRALPDLK